MPHSITLLVTQFHLLSLNKILNNLVSHSKLLLPCFLNDTAITTLKLILMSFLQIVPLHYPTSYPAH